MTIAYSRGGSTFDVCPEQRVADDFASFAQAIVGDRGARKGQQFIAGPLGPAPAGTVSGKHKVDVSGRPYRSAPCALPCRFLALDVDGVDEAGTWAELCLIASTWSAVAYETASSKPSAPRGRVIVELDAPLARSERIAASAALRRQIDGQLGAGRVNWDDSLDRPEQPIYLPLTAAWAAIYDGEPLQVASLAKRAPAAAVAARVAGSVAPLTDAERADLRSALAAIDSDDRNTWIAVGHDLHELGADGQALWVEWSQRSAKWQPGDANRWGTFYASQSGWRNVFKRAERAGWKNPAAGAQVAMVTMSQCDLFAWKPAHDPHTHVANAYRIRHHFADRLLHVVGIGWHVWGPPWRHDEMGALAIAQELGRIIAAEAAALAPWVAAAPDKDERQRRQKHMDARFGWATVSEQNGTILSSMRLAAPHVSCPAADLDADPYLLGLPSGVLDLRTGEVRQHRQGDRITKVAGTDLVPGALSPRWVQFLREIMGGDEELITYLQRLAGYALSGRRGDHLLPILWGSGANGKSTFVGALQQVLGDYAGTASPDLLIHRAGGEHPTSLADLQGRRLMIVSETGEGARLDEERTKWLTGGDTITARRMRQDFYQFVPSHLLVMQTNHRPRATGTDEGLWRRVRLIPFTVTVPADKRDPRLGETLRNELPGILAWALEGWRKYQKDGLPVPAAVQAASAEYRAVSDIIGQFLDECCIVDDYKTTKAAALYGAYVGWCENNGERPRSQRNFGMALSERGFERVRYGSGHRWRGIGLGCDLLGHGDQSDRSDGLSGLTPRETVSIADKPRFGVNGSHPSPAIPRPHWAEIDPKEPA